MTCHFLSSCLSITCAEPVRNHCCLLQGLRHLHRRDILLPFWENAFYVSVPKCLWPSEAVLVGLIVTIWIVSCDSLEGPSPSSPGTWWVHTADSVTWFSAGGLCRSKSDLSREAQKVLRHKSCKNGLCVGCLPFSFLPTFSTVPLFSDGHSKGVDLS